MKKSQVIVLSAAAALLTSCSGKLGELSADNFTVTPNPLECQTGQVAATINGAAAMGLSKDYGSIALGKVANFYVTQPIPSIDFIPYAYTTPIIRHIFLSGEQIALE